MERYSTEFHPYSKALEAVLRNHISQLSPSAGHPIDCEVLEHGKTGEKVCAMPSRLMEVFDDLTRKRRFVDVTVLLGGTNNLGCDESSTIFDSIIEMHEICFARGARTVCVSIPDSAVRKFPSIGEKVSEVNAKLKSWVKSIGSEKTQYLDLCAEMPNPPGEISPFWASDDVHMTREGYDHFGNLASQQILKFFPIDPVIE